jgi:hypothetical protein
MAYVVLRKGGISDTAYQTYARLLAQHLLRRGERIDQLPRVREGDSAAWYYVWENENEATLFAKELEKQTSDPGYYVKATKATPSVGPIRPLEIHVGRQRDGWVFALDPLSRKAIQDRYPSSCRRRSVFIGSESREEFLNEPGELAVLAEQVLVILTGLAIEKLAPFGSFRVVDPVSGEELLPPRILPPSQLSAE